MPKVKRTGYYLFMLDYKNREERSGRKFPGGMEDVRVLASDEWNELPKRMKDEYNARAKSMDKVQVPSKGKGKVNNLGIRLIDIDKEKLEQEEKRKYIQKFIFGLVNNISREELLQKYFHLIHVNYYCKTESGTYYPAEIAISKFSLSEGVTKVYHEFIDPGEIETGYSYMVKTHSEMFHRIPLHFDKAVKDHLKIFRDIINFLMENNHECPPLFTMYDDIPLNTSFTAVEKTLKNLFEVQYHAGDNDYNISENIFGVYPLPLLFYELKNLSVTGKGGAFPDSSIAKLELQKDTYNFLSDIACDFHSEQDNTTYCSKSYVLKWAYLIRDHCCKNFGINVEDVINTYFGREKSYETVSSVSSRYEDDEEGDGNSSDDSDSDDLEETRSIASNLTCRSNNTFYSEASEGTFKSASDYPGSSRSVPTWAVRQKTREVPNVTEDSFPPLKKSGSVTKQFKKLHT